MTYCCAEGRKVSIVGGGTWDSASTRIDRDLEPRPSAIPVVNLQGQIKSSGNRSIHNSTFLSRREFAITEIELKLMAAAARIGLSSNPKNGYRTPAAIGTPT